MDTVSSQLVAAFCSLGPLERGILEQMDECQKATVRQVHESGVVGRHYNTIAVTLERLAKKGFLEKTVKDRVSHYALRYPLKQVQLAVVVAKLVEAVTERDKGHLVLADLVDAVSEVDPKLLNEFEDQIRQRRLATRKRDNAR